MYTLSILIRTVAASGNIIGIFAFVRNAEMPLNGAATHIEMINALIAKFSPTT